MRIRQVGAELLGAELLGAELLGAELLGAELLGAQTFQADGQTYRQTDMARLIASLRNFANALEKALFSKNIFPFNSYGFTGKPTTNSG